MTFERLRRIIRLRLRSLFASTAVERELDDELRFHLDQQTSANVESGMTPDAARLAALRAIGGVEQRKEQVRDTRGVSLIENLVRDLRMAARQLRKQPAFTFAAVMSLALGIGANTAIFQLLSALSYRPLPVPAPQQLVEVRLTGNGRDGTHTGRNRQISLPQFREFERRQAVFSSMLAFSDMRFNLSPEGEVRYVDGLWVSGSFFSTLGIKPLLGRLIESADDVTGCQAQGAVISYALWQREFGGRPDVIGQPLTNGRARLEIIGVTPPDFFGIEVGRQFSVALPLCASGYTRPDHWWLAAVGRLQPDRTRAQASAQLAQLLPGILRDTMPAYNANLAREYLTMGIEVADASRGLSPLRRSYQRPLWILMAISALVLLIASVNLANLLLARATARRDEFAVCLALGGSRGRLLQQVFTESALLAAAGSIAAVGVALAVSRSIPPLISTPVDRIHLELAIDWRVFGFTAALGILTALIFGMAPAIKASRTAVLRGSARGAAGNDGMLLRRGLVAVQVAVTLVLLFGGLLFLRSFQNLSGAATGVRERGVVVATLFLSDRAYPEEKRGAAFRVLDEMMHALPAVSRVSQAYTTPLGGSIWDVDVVSDRGVRGASNGNRISPGYFATLGTPLLAGRDFTDGDVPGAPRVAIVNQSFAATYLGHDSVVGRHFTLPDDAGGQGEEFQIVGLVSDQKYGDMREANPRIFYTSLAQENERRTWRRYVMQPSGSSAQTIAAVTAATRQFDPTISIRYALLDDQIGESMLQERLMARLSAIFGGLALMLAAVGLYGLVSYSVASRRAEIGVRVALGASRQRILSMVLSDVGRILAAGVVAGTVLALAAGRGIGAMLFGLGANDMATLAMAAGVLLVTGLLSAAWPARRAAGIDPVTALREG